LLKTQAIHAAALCLLSISTGFAAQINFHNSSSGSVFTTLGAPTSHSSTSGSPYGNTRTFTVGSFSVVASAWSDTNDVSGPDTINTAVLGRFSHGLGVCNRDEDSIIFPGSCGDPAHMVDNSSGNENRDMILLRFSEAINLNSLTLYSFGYDRDISFWTRNNSTAPGSLSGKIPTTTNSAGNDLFDLGYYFNGSIDNTATPDPLTIDLGLGSAFVTEIIIAGKFANNEDHVDRFKLAAINYKHRGDPTIPGNEVPEPSTYATLGVALFGLAAWARRKR
jgi:hypothetical protein